MDSPATTAPADDTGTETEDFRALDRTLRESGPGAALDELVRRLTGRGESRPLLDALLLKARHDLGLPLIQEGGLDLLDEPTRAAYEERYIAAIRAVGALRLEAGDIPGAWPYFRAIGEPGPVARAIDAFAPPESDPGPGTDDDAAVGAIIEVAFNQGANPRRGFALILGHYGTCSAITAFEHLPADEEVRADAAGRLVRRLHEDLVANLRAEIAQRGQPLPAPGASIASLIAGRPWVFVDDAYHIDISHLSSVVRVAPLVRDPAILALAADLTEYGRNLSPRHRHEGEPPFEDHFEDHAVYLRALLGRDVDAAIAHFRAKLGPAEAGAGGDDGRGDPADTYPAQILVGLLLRLGRLDEAIEVSAGHLAGLPESALIVPGVAQLCQRAGQHGRLARIAREHGDLVHYAAAILQLPSPPPSGGADGAPA